MSAPGKPDPVKAWLFAEKLLREEADRVADLDDEEFEREMDAMPDPPYVPSVQELLARGEARARERRAQGIVVPRRARRAPWAIWLVAAVLGAAIAAIVTERQELAAWWRHEPEPIGPWPEEPEKVVSAPERAGTLRTDAFGACDDGYWALCNDKLDEAQKLDPGGEGDPRVQAARKAAYEGTHARPDGKDKTPK
jgi:hypothetical protein